MQEIPSLHSPGTVYIQSDHIIIVIIPQDRTHTHSNHTKKVQSRLDCANVWSEPKSGHTPSSYSRYSQVFQEYEEGLYRVHFRNCHSSASTSYNQLIIVMTLSILLTSRPYSNSATPHTSTPMAAGQQGSRAAAEQQHYCTAALRKSVGPGGPIKT